MYALVGRRVPVRAIRPVTFNADTASNYDCQLVDGDKGIEFHWLNKPQSVPWWRRLLGRWK